MKARILLFSLIGLLFISCSNEELLEPAAFEISGYWHNGEFSDSTSTFYRTNELSDNQYCFGFEANGKFVERKNSGWCGTPPIAYSEYEGTWTISDSTVNISVPFWGGESQLSWQIIEINNQQLVFEQVSYEHTFDDE